MSKLAGHSSRHHRPVLRQQQQGGQDESRKHDADGNRTTLVDQNNNQTSFTFDLAGRLTAETNAAGDETTYEYNSRNLIFRKTNARNQVTTYQYDDAGRLTGFTDPAGTVTYTYDANGNVLTVSDSVGTITREYDKLNRVTKYTDVSDNIIEYGYDANGNLTSLIYPGGKTVTYGYDKANRLTTVTDWAYRETSYDYDANGRLVKTTRPNGSILTVGYDTAGHMLWQNDVDSTGSGIARYEFTYDAMGNITVEESVYGNQYTLNNDYDAVYQILGQEKLDGFGSTVSQHGFGYDPGGNMTTEEEVYGPSEDVMTYTYDNRLATFNSQNVTYDADGNMTYGPLGGAMVTFNHDARNRLTGVGDLSYIYDALNNRVGIAEIVGENVYNTTFVTNPNADLSQTLIKTDPDGTKTYYIYGLGLIGEEKEGVYRSYHYDFRGSTVTLTDSNGDVTDRYSYGPYGELLTHTGIISTPFLYNGRDGVMIDDNGLYFMRARYYNPEIRRFITRDEFEGRYDEILNINLYKYANNNPVMNIDPEGELAKGTGKTWDQRLAGTLEQKVNKYILPSLNKLASNVTDDSVENFLSKSPLYNLNEAISGKSIILGNLSPTERQAKADQFDSLMSNGMVSLGIGGIKAGPNFVVAPSGEAIIVPVGAIGPGNVNTGKGFSFLEGSGGNGLNNRVTGVRIMDPTGRYPNGYVVYMNQNGQTVNPWTGRTVGKSDPFAHLWLNQGGD